MDKGLKRRIAAAPASRGGGGGGGAGVGTTYGGDESGDANMADGGQGGGGGGGGSFSELPLYNTSAGGQSAAANNNNNINDGRASLRRRKKAGTSAALNRSSNAWCTWGGFLTLLLMTVVGWILSLMLFSGSSSSSQRMAQQALHAVTGLSYYTPKLYNNAGVNHNDDININNNKEKYKKEDFPWPMIHIVNTRFMQEQANLTALGQARLALFQVFCLPTMQHQTSQQFLWIIRTDPNLDTKLLKKLVRLVQPFPNVYIVGSNHNFRINQDFPGAWRNGAQARDLAGLDDYHDNPHENIINSKNAMLDASGSSSSSSVFPTRVYTGNKTLLEMAMALEAQLPILETRLDADDGLHVQFIETLQKEAWEQAFSKQHQQQHQEPRLKWKYWCAQRNVEWHWSSPSPLANNNNNNKKQHLQHQQGAGKHDHDMSSSSSSSLFYGKMSGVQHQAMCITAGITVGFPVGTAERQVPVFPHHELAWRIRHGGGGDENSPQQHSSSSCGLLNTSNCLEFLKVHPFEAVRSRTPTSHGMLDILLGGSSTKDYSAAGGPPPDDDHQERHRSARKDEEEDEENNKDEQEDAWLNYAYWDILNRRFRIQREQVRFVQEYLMDNLVEIAKDNLLGQCTTGHSCKPEAKKALETIIATYSSDKMLH